METIYVRTTVLLGVEETRGMRILGKCIGNVEGEEMRVLICGGESGAIDRGPIREESAQRSRVKRSKSLYMVKLLHSTIDVDVESL